MNPESESLDHPISGLEIVILSSSTTNHIIIPPEFQINVYTFEYFNFVQICKQSQNTVHIVSVFPSQRKNNINACLCNNPRQSMTRSIWSCYVQLSIHVSIYSSFIRILTSVIFTILLFGGVSNVQAYSNQQLLESFDQDQMTRHCFDSNGTLHGLFSSWLEKPTCRCTCYPTAGLAVSICDACVVPTSSYQTKNNFNLKGEKTNGVHEEPRKDCWYSATGAVYHHNEVWMSTKKPCVKCRCDEGEIRCIGEPHHCPPLCLPGQHMMPPGPCCETTCRGKTLNTSIAIFANCSHPLNNTQHLHGDFITLDGACVDQKCLCVNGRWTCLDYCIPMEKLPCPANQIILWDPFCCPKCPGVQQCNVLLQSGDEVIKTREEKPSESFIRIYREDKINLTKEQHNFSVTTNAVPESSLTAVMIPSGTQVALAQGHCFCVNSSILCPRPGRQIWHDDDCYYVDNYEGTYHAPESQWIPQGDACTECQCLRNRTYSCKPKTCEKLFLCEFGKQPIILPGECCPSFCGVAENRSETNERKAISPASKLNKEPRTSLVSQTESKAIPTLNNEVPIPEGCPSFDGIRDNTIFPRGSRLILSRPCRSLLCICSRDDRWICNDYCPPCLDTISSIDAMSSIGHLPLPGKCCPLCEHNVLPGVRLISGAKGKDNQQRGRGALWYDATHSDELSHKHDWMRSDMIYTAPLQYSYPKSKSDIEKEELRSTVKLYVIIASMTIFVVLGIPMGSFITWYCVKRRKRKWKRQNMRYRHIPKRRSPYIVTMTRRPLYVATSQMHHMRQSTSSTVSPNTSISAKPSPLCEHCLTGVQKHDYRNSTCEGRQTDKHGQDVFMCVQAAVEEQISRKPNTINTIREKPGWNHESKSVPPSPVSSRPIASKPRRVKSLWKTADPLLIEHLAPIELIKTTRTEYTTPIVVEECCADQEPIAVRRTASNVSTLKRAGPLKSRSLARASTWLTGMRAPSHIIRRLLSSTSRNIDKQNYVSRNEMRLVGMKPHNFDYNTECENNEGPLRIGRRHSNESTVPDLKSGRTRTQSEVRLKNTKEDRVQPAAQHILFETFKKSADHKDRPEQERRNSETDYTSITDSLTTYNDHKSQGNINDHTNTTGKDDIVLSDRPSTNPTTTTNMIPNKGEAKSSINANICFSTWPRVRHNELGKQRHNASNKCISPQNLNAPEPAASFLHCEQADYR